jgi:hypothetical protein
MMLCDEAILVIYIFCIMMLTLYYCDDAIYVAYIILRMFICTFAMYKRCRAACFYMYLQYTSGVVLLRRREQYTSGVITAYATT